MNFRCNKIHENKRSFVLPIGRTRHRSGKYTSRRDCGVNDDSYGWDLNAALKTLCINAVESMTGSMECVCVVVDWGE